MKRYLHLILVFIVLNSKRYLENRVNTIGTLIISFISVFIAVLFIEFIYSFINDIKGWSKFQVIFLIGVSQLFGVLFSMIFLRSINYVPNVVNRGYLDLLLTKPANSQFLLSFRFIRTYEFLNLVPGALLIYYSLSNLGYRGNFGIWALFILAFISGMLILYGLFFSLATLTFWFGHFNSLSSVIRVLMEPLSIPVDFFGNNIRFLLTYILPLGFVVTIPVKLFFGLETRGFLLLSAVISILSVSFSIWLWNLALKRYTSASS